MSRFAKAKVPTPLLNTPNFQEVFGAEKLPLDDQGLFRELEMVALPGTKLEIKKMHDQHIAEVKTAEYPFSALYADLRMLEGCDANSSEREKKLPPIETIHQKLISALGLPYVWGGNWGKGIPELKSHYNQNEILAGVDCSGLLYEATSGYTPRNTKELMTFGHAVNDELKALDLIIWPGHVVIVFDEENVIESLHGKGVILSGKKKRWGEISQTQNVVFRRFII